MTQTAVSAAPAIGVPGQLADESTLRNGDIVARTNSETSASLPFGIMVMKGTADRAVKLITATSAKLGGVIVWAHGYARDSELDANGLRPGCTFDVLNRGRILVRVEDAVTPASEVHVRAVTGGANGYGTAGAENKGAFRGTADSTDCIDCSAFCKFISSADAGAIAELEVDMSNAALQVADV